jgi:hypothetical protein
VVAESQILKAKKPGDIFSNNASKIKDEYKSLVKRYHPDVNKSPNANEVFQKINELYEQGLKDIESDKWERKNFVQLNKKDGKKVQIVFLSHTAFELGEMYVCDTHLIYIFNNDKKKYYDNMLKRLENISYMNGEMEKEFKRYLPSLETTYETMEGNFVAVFKKTVDVYPLKNVLDALGGELEGRHIAWIMSRLSNLCCFLKYNNLVHNGLTIDNCFISPEYHSILLLGGWWYTVGTDEKMIGMTKEVYDFVPISSKESKIASPISDLESIKNIGRILGGSGNPRIFSMKTDIPKPLRDFLVKGAGNDAYKEFSEWDSVLTEAYGVRKFIPLLVTKNQIYKN